ncbi:DNA-binding protein [Luteimonas mephitis]|uniref:DNA-binding protein n=1 Tax=Luteimonas mephitis TaxID=83615 RepID=UPI0004070BBD|nr:DNA-binding protein [Luteimonas mephitis]
MARGITESDVHTAADEIVGAGERPTVERIRAHLGTGSPNTVTRWLETWWKGLGQRLEVQQASLSLPQAPDAVAKAAGELWRLALEHAQANAKEVLEAERAALQEGQTALQAERESFALEATALRDKVEVASQAERVASTQAAELNRLVSQMEGQAAELTQQRDFALEQAANAEITRQAAERRLQALQDAAQAERETLAKHVQATEDRAHAEVDRARQQSRELQSRLTALQKEQAASQKAHFVALEQSNAKAMEAQRQAEIQKAKAEALAGQLSQLRDLPAELELVLRQAKKAAPSPRKMARRNVQASQSKKVSSASRKTSAADHD